MRNLILTLVLAILFSCIDNTDKTFAWPNGAKAAICLTYDDGLASHVNHVVPTLNQFGIKGTFFAQGNATSLQNEPKKWRQLAKDGHELANHTMYHPCQKVKEGRAIFDWVKAEYDLNFYTKSQLLEELRQSDSLLYQIDQVSKRTFAYTCCDHEVSGESFVEDIRPLFSAARLVGPIPNSLKGLDLMLMPSWPVTENSGAEMIAYVESAAQKGTVGTIMFHGVGAEYQKVSEEAHLELIEHLAKYPDKFYVATFKEITDYIRDKRENNYSFEK